MTGHEVLDTARETVWVLLKISLPLLLIALIVGLVIALIQALTQMQEMTLSFVPKIVAIFLGLLLFFPMMSRTLEDFNHMLMDKIASMP